MSSEEIYNYLKVSEDILTAGQPTAEQLRAAAKEGVVNVINLATDNPPHSPEDEARLARALGLNYTFTSRWRETILKKATSRRRWPASRPARRSSTARPTSA
ncbi:MAG: hypothetical protein RMK99_00300 [Anaerolineales bacterium]|nr:hypothetical protein [Anaerolineales bacterium]